MIFYHGTSSIFLKNIQDNGLKASPPQKTIYDYNVSSLEYPSLVSLHGIYFSVHEKLAYGYAKVTCGKYGGRPLIVSSKLNLDDCVSDEDHIRCWVERAFQQTMTFYGFKNTQYATFIGFSESDKRKNIINTFSYFFKNLIEDYEPVSEKLENMFNCCVDRYVAHLLHQSKQKFYNEYQSGNSLFKHPEMNYTIQESEIKYLEALNSLCYSYTKSITDFDRPSHSLRYIYDIKPEELDLSFQFHQV